MQKIQKRPEAVLYEIAEAQHGYFTSKQAIEAGFASNNHSYYTKHGHWRNVMRGIYRLVKYPASEYEDLFIWYLWSRDRNDKPQCVFSYETALDIYDLSDNNPNRIHMTIPKKFRKLNETPAMIKLHKENIDEKNVKYFQGMRVTTPLKTLIDIVTSAELSEEIIVQAVEQSIKKGLVTIKEFEENKILKQYLRIKI